MTKYPKGEIFKFGKDTCRVYSGKVTIETAIERVAKDQGPLTVSVSVHPFSAKRGLSTTYRVLKQEVK